MKNIYIAYCILLLASMAAYESHGGAANASAVSDTVAHFNTLHAADKTMPTLVDGHAEVNGQTLHYVSAGSGQLVVLYHGFPSYWYAWKEQLAQLAKHYRVVAVDGLGINLSDQPESIEHYKIQNLASQLNSFITQINGKQEYILMGHDWGGALAWAYAQRYPDNIDKLVVFSAPPYNLFLELLSGNADQQQSSAYVNRLKSMADIELGPEAKDRMWSIGYSKLINNGLISVDDGDQFRNAMHRGDTLLGGVKWYKANIPVFEEIEDSDFWPSRTASTSVPSLLVWGEKDRTFVAECIRRLPQYASDLRVEIIPNANHWPMFEAKEEVNTLVADFLELDQTP